MPYENIRVIEISVPRRRWWHPSRLPGYLAACGHHRYHRAHGLRRLVVWEKSADAKTMGVMPAPYPWLCVYPLHTMRTTDVEYDRGGSPR